MIGCLKYKVLLVEMIDADVRRFPELGLRASLSPFTLAINKVFREIEEPKL